MKTHVVNAKDKLGAADRTVGGDGVALRPDRSPRLSPGRLFGDPLFGDRLFGDHGRDLASVANAGSIGFLRYLFVMSEETTNQQSCGGKKRAMLAYGLVQISATVVSAVS